jgi:hypothetical protein
MWIRDPGWKKSGSGIDIPDPQHGIQMDQHYFGQLDPDRIRVTIQELKWLKKWCRGGQWSLTMDAWRLKTGALEGLYTIRRRFASY